METTQIIILLVMIDCLLVFRNIRGVVLIRGRRVGEGEGEGKGERVLLVTVHGKAANLPRRVMPQKRLNFKSPNFGHFG